MRWGLLFGLLLGGCFGCEQETKVDDPRQVVAAWVMQIGDQPTLVYVTAPDGPSPVTVRVNNPGCPGGVCDGRR